MGPNQNPPGVLLMDPVCGLEIALRPQMWEDMGYSILYHTLSVVWETGVASGDGKPWDHSKEYCQSHLIILDYGYGVKCPGYRAPYRNIVSR